jgi:hypothetical protein
MNPKKKVVEENYRRLSPLPPGGDIAPCAGWTDNTAQSIDIERIARPTAGGAPRRLDGFAQRIPYNLQVARWSLRYSQRQMSQEFSLLNLQ